MSNEQVVYDKSVKALSDLIEWLDSCESVVEPSSRVKANIVSHNHSYSYETDIQGHKVKVQLTKKIVNRHYIIYAFGQTYVCQTYSEVKEFFAMFK